MIYDILSHSPLNLTYIFMVTKGNNYRIKPLIFLLEVLQWSCGLDSQQQPLTELQPPSCCAVVAIVVSRHSL